MKHFFTFCLSLLIPFFIWSQTTNIVILDSTEIQLLKKEIQKNNSVYTIYQSILSETLSGLKNYPKPLKTIHYEGLLDNDPKRINTVKSFVDIDYVVGLIYSCYGTENAKFGKKAKEIILAWARKYEPTGNPINENKLNAFYWGYYLFKSDFNKKEQRIVESWLLKIAEK